MDGFPLAPDEVRILTGDDAQRALGAALAAALPPGSVLFLEGELGAGKTTLTRVWSRHWASRTPSPVRPTP